AVLDPHLQPPLAEGLTLLVEFLLGHRVVAHLVEELQQPGFTLDEGRVLRLAVPDGQDRKSTRLNSSHVKISYAVFSLKKKTTICMFVGLIILGHIVGGYDLNWTLAAGDLIRARALYVTALVLILMVALTRTTQFPLLC